MAIPVVDLSPFLTVPSEEGRDKCRMVITEASSDHGFFQIVNHGVPLGLMARALDVSKSFFESTNNEEKLELTARFDTPLPSGYNYDNRSGKKEDFFFPPPRTEPRIFPNHPSDYREVMEELFTHFAKTSQLIESIINDCLGLPPNFLKEYNQDRSRDLMVALRYSPGAQKGSIGGHEHQDPNVITLILQDDAGGLQVRLDNGERIPVTPVEGAIVVNISDIIQVLSNGKFKSGFHRVMSPQGRSRHSIGFFYNLDWNQWVEPLPQFTEQIGNKPKYRGFLYKDYVALKLREKAENRKPEDMINGIAHYTISNAL